MACPGTSQRDAPNEKRKISHTLPMPTAIPSAFWMRKMAGSSKSLIAELKPNSPPGSTPNSSGPFLRMNRLLFVANANINAIAVFDVKEIGKSPSLGFIPVGWYPTSVRVTPNGKHLLVTNGKGIMPKSKSLRPSSPVKGLPGGRAGIYRQSFQRHSQHHYSAGPGKI